MLSQNGVNGLKVPCVDSLPRPQQPSATSNLCTHFGFASSRTWKSQNQGFCTLSHRHLCHRSLHGDTETLSSQDSKEFQQAHAFVKSMAKQKINFGVLSSLIPKETDCTEHGWCHQRQTYKWPMCAGEHGEGSQAESLKALPGNADFPDWSC